MPAANPLSTEAPCRPGASARAGGARPSEPGFSGQLAQALATPAPGSAPQQSPAQQQAAEKSEPSPGAAQAASTAAPATAAPAAAADAAAPTSDPEISATPALPGQSEGQEGVVAVQSDEASPDEPAADAVQAEPLPSDPAVTPAPMPQPAASQGSVPVAAAPEEPPGDARSDTALSPAAAAVEAPGSSMDEKASGEREPSGPDAGTLVADIGQAASPHTAPAAMPSAPDAASSPAIQPHAPAHAARADAPPAPAAPPPPAAQVAPAVAALFSVTAADGVQRTLVRLDPVELGQVEVRVERVEGGPAAVALTVERPETLLLLVRDQAGLHRALDQAGVPAEGRTVKFQLGQFQLGQQDPGAPGQQLDAGAGGGWGGGGARHGRGEANRGWRHPGDRDTQGVRTAWSRAGVDITA